VKEGVAKQEVGIVDFDTKTKRSGHPMKKIMTGKRKRRKDITIKCMAASTSIRKGGESHLKGDDCVVSVKMGEETSKRR